MKKLNTYLLALLTFAMFTTSCSDDDSGRERITISPGDNAQTEAQTAFIEVQSGMDIYFEEGTYNFTSQLSIDDKTDVRIYGAGREKTILNFSNQTGSGEGVYASNCTQILFQDFTVQDTQGDALKAKDSDQVTFINVGTVWSGEPDADNGAYGLYPVQCTNVLIDGCYAYGASDAGIYVGQTTNVVVRNSVAEGNVAGIEIENTINADVYDNEAFDNTGGILVFDLPGLTQYGSNCRLFNNNSHDNNRTNFAPEGNIVGTVPAGTGIMLLSTTKVEIFENTLTDNMFSNVILASYLMVGEPNDPNYQSLYTDIYIHDNSHAMAGTFNESGQSEIGAFIANFLSAYGYDQPNILMDGLTGGGICIFEADGTSFVNVHAESLNTNTGEGNPDSNLAVYTCNADPLEAVVFEPYASSL